MKVYNNLHQSEGLPKLIGYQCDSCSLFAAGEDLPSDFIVTQGEHFCFDCQEKCKCCENIFSIKYFNTWTGDGICENCHDNFEEEK